MNVYAKGANVLNANAMQTNANAMSVYVMLLLEQFS